MGTSAYVVFRVTDLPCALACDQVRSILPVPLLGRPPSRPSVVEGVLDLAGVAVPVLRLDRLFGLQPSPLRAYQHLIVLRACEPPLALLVDRATDVARVPPDRVAPLHRGETLNGCVVGEVTIGDEAVHLISAERLLDERERQALAEFQTMQQQRLEQARAPS